MSGVPTTSIGSSEEAWDGEYNGYTATVTICTAIALYNAIELGVLIFTTFKQMRGLYFWSLTVSTFGLLPYSIGFLIEYFRLTYRVVGLAMDGAGWIMLITGEALVLYSRLGLILQNPMILRYVKYTIAFNALVWHTTTEILNFGQAFGPVRTSPPNRAGFATAYRAVEKVQMTMFTLQEFIISGLYAWQTLKLLNVVHRERTRIVMWQLFLINVIIIVLDIGLLAIEYKDQHVLEQTVKGLTYSIKLKLEFVILGKLVDLVHSSKRSLSSAFAEGGNEHRKFRLYEHDPRPRWLQDLERRNSATNNAQDCGQAERRTSTEKNGVSGPTTISMDFAEFEKSSVTPLERFNTIGTVETRRTISSHSSVMYAEALRNIASPDSR